MSITGELERLFADQLYPYRWLLLAGALAVLCAVVVAGHRLGWHRSIARHRLIASVVAAVVLVAGVPAGYYTLSPLWLRSEVTEASPLDVSPGEPAATPAGAVEVDVGAPAAGAQSAAPPAPLSSAPAAAVFMPRLAHAGTFRGADEFHFGRGRALIIETEPGRYVLRFEDFSVRNGPDLFVYLSPNEDGDITGAVNLGRLRATDGAFNYEVPVETDVTRMRSAVVWCRRFGVLFASAVLSPAS